MERDRVSITRAKELKMTTHRACRTRILIAGIAALLTVTVHVGADFSEERGGASLELGEAKAFTGVFRRIGGWVRRAGTYIKRLARTVESLGKKCAKKRYQNRKECKTYRKYVEAGAPKDGRIENGDAHYSRKKQ